MDKKLKISSGTKVAVMGLGVSGWAAVRYALHQKAEVFISDIRPEEKFAKEEGFVDMEGIHLEIGEHTAEFLGQADIVIVSPGISVTTPLMDELHQKGVTVVGELAFAAAYVDKPVVAITGTNGKTTVTTLIGELLKGAGKRVFVGGNIGTSLFDYFLDPHGFDLLVLEVSSFQLESAGDFSPDVAILLNVSPDHLDRHGSLEEYRKAKMKIFSCQQEGDMAIINGDDPECAKLPENLLSETVMFGADEKFVAGISGNDVVLYPGSEREKYSLASTSLKGQIGASNCAPAILAARYLGCSRMQIQRVLNTFSSLEHRMEFVHELGGVSYYNDSKATNTGAVVAALNQFEGKVILIAGGRDKGDDYTLLKPSVSEKVEMLVAIGESSDLLEKALLGSVNIVKAASMKDAVQKAAEGANPGDSVLLSPACASFDMFTGYDHRGRAFKEEVRALNNSRQIEGVL